MPYRAAGGNASGWAIMMSEASPSAASRDSPSALMILARFPARPRPGDHGPFHGVVRRGGRIIPAQSPSFDLRRAGAPLRIKKIRALPCSRECYAGAAARVRSDILILSYFSDSRIWSGLFCRGQRCRPVRRSTSVSARPETDAANGCHGLSNRSTTQIPGVHHDPDIVVQNPAHKRGSKAAACLQ